MKHFQSQFEDAMCGSLTVTDNLTAPHQETGSLAQSKALRNLNIEELERKFRQVQHITSVLSSGGGKPVITMMLYVRAERSGD